MLAESAQIDVAVGATQLTDQHRADAALIQRMIPMQAGNHRPPTLGRALRGLPGRRPPRQAHQRDRYRAQQDGADQREAARDALGNLLRSSHGSILAVDRAAPM